MRREISVNVPIVVVLEEAAEVVRSFDGGIKEGAHECC